MDFEARIDMIFRSLQLDTIKADKGIKIFADKILARFISSALDIVEKGEIVLLFADMDKVYYRSQIVNMIFLLGWFARERFHEGEIILAEFNKQVKKENMGDPERN